MKARDLAPHNRDRVETFPFGEDTNRDNKWDKRNSSFPCRFLKKSWATGSLAGTTNGTPEIQVFLAGFLKKNWATGSLAGTTNGTPENQVFLAGFLKKAGQPEVSPG